MEKNEKGEDRPFTNNIPKSSNFLKMAESIGSHVQCQLHKNEI